MQSQRCQTLGTSGLACSNPVQKQDCPAPPGQRSRSISWPGSLVKVKASAKGRIISVDIDESLLQPSEKGMVEDLVAAAFNDARAKADAASGAEMSKLTQGMPLPPGFKLPF